MQSKLYLSLTLVIRFLNLDLRSLSLSPNPFSLGCSTTSFNHDIETLLESILVIGIVSLLDVEDLSDLGPLGCLDFLDLLLDSGVGGFEGEQESLFLFIVSFDIVWES